MNTPNVLIVAMIAIFAATGCNERTALPDGVLTCEISHHYDPRFTQRENERIAEIRARQCLQSQLIAMWQKKQELEDNTGDPYQSRIGLAKRVLADTVGTDKSVGIGAVVVRATTRIGYECLTKRAIEFLQRDDMSEDWETCARREKDLIGELNYLSAIPGARPPANDVEPDPNAEHRHTMEKIAANGFFEKALVSWPDEEERKAYYWSDIAVARDYISQATQLDPNVPAFYAARGKLALMDFFFESALEDFQRAIDLDPAFAAAHEGKSLAYGWLDQERKAWLSAKKACSLGRCRMQALLEALDVDRPD